MTACSVFQKKAPVDNLLITAVDRGSVKPSADRQIYYRILIDRQFAGKTEPGLFFQKKSAGFIVPVSKVLLSVERYRLESGADEDVLKEYRRSNNIYQLPEGIYIDIPQEGRVEVTTGYDHSSDKPYIEKKLIHE